MTEDQARQPGLVEWLATTIDCTDPDAMARVLHHSARWEVDTLDASRLLMGLQSF